MTSMQQQEPPESASDIRDSDQNKRSLRGNVGSGVVEGP